MNLVLNINALAVIDVEKMLYKVAILVILWDKVSDNVNNASL